MSCAKHIVIIDIYVGLFLDIESRMVEVLHIVVTVWIIAVFDWEYVFIVHGDTTYQHKYKRKSLGLVSFLLHMLLEYILFDNSGLIKMTDRSWPNF